MQPSPNHAPWQVAPVSAAARVAAAALAMLAVDSMFLWSTTTSTIQAAALTAVPVVVAVRVIRGFPRSRELASATFALSLVFGIAALFQVEIVAGQARAAVVVAIALTTAGLLTSAWAGLRHRFGTESVITMPRWPSVPVAVRTPSRYQSRRQYR